MVQSLAARWVRRLFSNNSSPRPAALPTFRPTLERLEDRLTPSIATANFALPPQFFGADFISSEVAADLNGDGRPDIVTLNGDNTLSVFLNSTAAGASTPTFSPPVSIPAFFDGFAALSLAVADVNGDGKPDLIVGNGGPDELTVLLNTTQAGDFSPTFVAQVPVGLNFTPRYLAAADFNGDGRPDIVAAGDNFTSPIDTFYVSVVLNQTADGAATTTFAAPQAVFVGLPNNDNIHSVTAADFNGDGRPDLAFTDFTEGGSSVSVLLDTTAAGAAAASFGARQTFALSSAPGALATADFNGDGRSDLVVVLQGSDIGVGGRGVSVLLDTTPAGAAVASFAAPQTFAVDANVNAFSSVSVADFNGDGSPDIAVYSGEGMVSLLQNETPQPSYSAGGGANISTTPAFAVLQTFAVGGSPTRPAMAVGDFNGDGRPDLAFGADIPNGQQNSLILVLGVLTNTTLVPSPNGTSDLTPFDAAPVAVADFTGAGVEVFNRILNAWEQLPALPAGTPGAPANHTPDASLLATDAAGYVVADFTGLGVWRYAPATGLWTMVNGHDATALAIDGAGDVFGSFAGAGTGKFRLDGSARLLSPAVATQLASDATGDLLGGFLNYGVWRMRPYDSAWRLINGFDADAIALDGRGDAFLSYIRYGVGEFRLDGNGEGVSTDGAGAGRLAADAYGDVALSLQTGPVEGVAEFFPTNPFNEPTSQLPITAARLTMTDNGDIIADFTGYGIWEFDPYYGWYQLANSSADPALLVAG